MFYHHVQIFSSIRGILRVPHGAESSDQGSQAWQSAGEGQYEVGSTPALVGSHIIPDWKPIHNAGLDLPNASHLRRLLP